MHCMQAMRAKKKLGEKNLKTCTRAVEVNSGDTGTELERNRTRAYLRVRDERRIIFHGVEHVTVARDQTSHKRLDFKQVADWLARPISDADDIISGRCAVHGGTPVA